MSNAPIKSGTFEVVTNKNGTYYVRLVANNGKILMHSESFKTKDPKQSKRVALKNVEAVKRCVFNSKIVIFDNDNNVIEEL